MDGFVADYAHRYPDAALPERQEVMAWYPRGMLPGLHTLAEQFVICDHWFSSMPGPTWPNRLFAHSGTSLGHVDMPGGVFTAGLHVYDQRTLYDELDAARVDWRIYYGDFPQSLVLASQLEKPAGYRRFDDFVGDVAAGDLPPYVFIEPAYFWPAENDQHPPQDVHRGDVLIAQIYNALLANPTLFAETLLVVLYDEHGGFFDHVPPPPCVPPDASASVFGFDRLGPRVPAVLVSPWLDPGVVNEVYDHTSLLKMACGLWLGVQPLGARTAAAKSPLEALAWRTTPRTDMPPAPIATAQPAPATAALTGQRESLLGYSQYLESKLPEGPAKAGLMARSHEAMGGTASQSALARDRVEAFLAAQEGAGA
jgi:phospholipase C